VSLFETSSCVLASAADATVGVKNTAILQSSVCDNQGAPECNMKSARRRQDRVLEVLISLWMSAQPQACLPCKRLVISCRQACQLSMTPQQVASVRTYHVRFDSCNNCKGTALEPKPDT